MASTPPPKDTLLSYLKVQKDHDRRMYSLLNQAASDVDKQLRRTLGTGIGAEVRRGQLLLVKKTVLDELSKLMTKAGYVVQSLKYAAAAAAVEESLKYEEVLFNLVPQPDVFDVYKTAARRQAKSGIEAAEQRLLGTSYRPLAESVYRTEALAAGQVDRLVNSALARGLSAAELAKEVTAFIKPNVAGGVSYAALRLGRTELNNAFHAKAAEHARNTPFSDGVIWHLSGSHPRPDECNDYAANDVPHMPSGFFYADDIPAKPHPQCLCYITEEVVGEDDFLDNFFAGRYDTFLQSLRR